MIPDDQPIMVETSRCVDPASILPVVEASPNQWLLLVIAVAILIPALLWTANEWRTWRVRRSLRQSVSDAFR